MSQHIQPISHYPPHERINLIKKDIETSHSNLTQRVVHDCDEQRWSRRVPRLVKLSCGYYIYVLNLKPLKCNKAFPCHCESEKFYHVLCFPRKLWKGCYMQPESLWAMLKNRYLGSGSVCAIERFWNRSNA